MPVSSDRPLYWISTRGVSRAVWQKPCAESLCACSAKPIDDGVSGCDGWHGRGQRFDISVYVLRVDIDCQGSSPSPASFTPIDPASCLAVCFITLVLSKGPVSHCASVCVAGVVGVAASRASRVLRARRVRGLGARACAVYMGRRVRVWGLWACVWWVHAVGARPCVPLLCAYAFRERSVCTYILWARTRMHPCTCVHACMHSTSWSVCVCVGARTRCPSQSG